MRPSSRLVRALLAVVPALMLTFAVPFVNRVDARVLGLPFLLVWIVAWVALTPLFLLTISRIGDGR
ncbi:MAG: DUF3311 domain-containing protein [Candidatus Eremiobacteraeota bacterium]|nr:DUF3311 domain-containing protein [Candidatus Eremiobacteraeota bacterium]